jgi:hypothetical protein
MKHLYKSLKLLLTALIFVIVATIAKPVYAQKKGETLKIGTYDSRVITFAWSRSDYFKHHMSKYNSQSDSARKVNDSAKIRELSVQGMSYQHLLHQMVFSTGMASSIMELIRNQLPELAKKEDVSMIVSKWELNFVNPTVEIVDLTNQIAQLQTD